VNLAELDGFPSHLVELLEKGGRSTLRDILDLERDEVMKMEGMGDEDADLLMGILAEVTEENTEDGDPEAEGSPEEATAAAPGDPDGEQTKPPTA